MSGCPEPLERIFRQVEEESERRAEEELKRAEELDKFVQESTTVRKTRTRRRGSISISRLGQFTVEEMEDLAKSPSGPASPKGFSIASTSPFYQAQIANASTSSVASGASAFSNDEAHTEDLSQVIQVQQIPSKTSTISKILPRRLSRARSSSVIPSSEGNVVPIGIGVSVQETTVHSSAASIAETESRGPSRRASVHAPRMLKSQPSKASLKGSTTSNATGWVARARGFTQKFRRKSKQNFGDDSVQAQ
ncbi:hypothetical protein CC1G_11126 [Coprinopsis cinerea okayama7|uniref:Uncharacterized protein n=1 Tax=Coprinopsis cinerea (strain Okayama-7 / 130 / ATCC MYA-4618 / FGSC 9003) TaxID=240176 RepID=A8N4R1_COPC7|nr:hypothetical protein CC1G_11126 [Coprinopsis cinerea okayama7\|eukprot:XP_001829856.1 hypothetical protein CC1G_11126 [Coprinopsis cinerea okayama7\